MKKTLILLSLFLCSAGFVQAQEARAFKKLGIGFYAGPQILGKIYTDQRLSKVSGISAGLDLRYSFSDEPQGFSLHIQPGYNTFRKFSAEGKFTPFYFESTWKWTAIHIPVLFRYTLSSGKVRPFAEFGPSFRLRTALSVKNSGYVCGILGCSGRESAEDLQSITSKDVVGLTAGAGVEVDLWKVTIPVSMRIQEGFGTFGMEGPVYDGPYYTKLKTRTIQVTAGISF